MKITLVTDAWEPQVNGVVTTLRELVRELSLLGHLREAWYRALTVPRAQARARALEFEWTRAARLFLANLVPLRQIKPGQEFVTSLSSNR